MRARRAGGSDSICRCAVAPSTSSSSVRTCAARTSAQPLGAGDAGAGARRPTAAEHAIERAVLAVEEDLVLAAEVVVEIRGREVGGLGDVAHAGVGEPALAEHARRGAQDGVALRDRGAAARAGGRAT